MRNKSETLADRASAVVAAAAGLATSTISTAATEATKTLSVAAAKAMLTIETAATKALNIVEVAAAKAVGEFPNLQEDMRQIHSAQDTQTATIVNVVTELIRGHTESEDGRLKSIGESVGKIESHMITQNGRLSKAETHITRQNLIIFGIAGPIGLLIIGYFAPHIVEMSVKTGGWGAVAVAVITVLLVLTILLVVAVRLFRHEKTADHDIR